MKQNSRMNDYEFKQFRQSVVLNKKYNADAIKMEEKRRERKIKNYRQSKIMSSSFDYRNRMSSEFTDMSQVGSKLTTLEQIENALLNKLKNTRSNVEKANQEYMNALDNAYSSQESRINALKQKLEMKRNKNMVQIGISRSASQSKLNGDHKDSLS